MGSKRSYRKKQQLVRDVDLALGYLCPNVNTTVHWQFVQSHLYGPSLSSLKSLLLTSESVREDTNSVTVGHGARSLVWRFHLPLRLWGLLFELRTLQQEQPACEKPVHCSKCALSQKPFEQQRRPSKKFKNKLFTRATHMSTSRITFNTVSQA